MKKIVVLLWISVLIVLSIMATGCPGLEQKSQQLDQTIKQETRVGAFDEATHARDLAIKAAIEANITTDPVLKWYSSTYGGLTVEVSHAVATVTMKVKTKEQRDQIISLAKQAKDCRDVIDNITIDPKLDDPPFEW